MAGRTRRARAPTSRPRCRRTLVRRSARQAWPRSWPRSRARGRSRASPVCPGEGSAPDPRASRVSPTVPGSAPRRGQPGGSGSGDPSGRFPAGQPRRRRGPPPPASAPGRPGPHSRGIATAAAPGPCGPAAAAAGWPPASLPGCARPRAGLAWRLSPGPIPRRGSPRRPPASGAAGRPAQAQAPAGHVRGSGGDTPPDRCRQVRLRRACRCSWPAPGSSGAAPSQGPACPPPRSGRGAAGRPLSGQAGQKRRPTHPGRARRYPLVRATGPTRPPHPDGNAPPPRPTSRTPTPRPARPAQDRAAPQPSPVLSHPQSQLGRPSAGTGVLASVTWIQTCPEPSGAGRYWSRPARGWLVQERARDPDRGIWPGAGAPGPRVRNAPGCSASWSPGSGRSCTRRR